MVDKDGRLLKEESEEYVLSEGTSTAILAVGGQHPNDKTVYMVRGAQEK